MSTLVGQGTERQLRWSETTGHGSIGCVKSASASTGGATFGWCRRGGELARWGAGVLRVPMFRPLTEGRRSDGDQLAAGVTPNMSTRRSMSQWTSPVFASRAWRLTASSGSRVGTSAQAPGSRNELQCEGAWLPRLPGDSAELVMA